MKALLIVISILVLSSCKIDTPSYDEILPELIENYDINKLDSLSQMLIGSQIAKHNWLDIKNTSIILGQSGRPIYLQATASWCKPCAAMIPALNDMAEKYGNQVDFILVSFDQGKKAQKYKSRLHKNIRLIPATEKTNPNAINKLVAGDFAHIFPFPTTYYLNPNRIIHNIEIGGPVPIDESKSENEKVYLYHTKSISKALNAIVK